MARIHVSGSGISSHRIGASYDGSKTGSDLSYWSAQSYDPSDFVSETYDVLASRCATLYNTSPLARAMVKKPLAYSIGRGLFFRSLPNWKMLGIKKEEAMEFGRRFTLLLHYDKLNINHYAKQYDLMAEQSITGDSLLFFIRENDDKPFDIVTSSGVNVIDSCHSLAPTSTENGYTLGIEHDRFMRRYGFWARNEQELFKFSEKNGDRNAILCMIRERSGQIRGYSDLYSMVALLKNLDRVWDATIGRMVLESIMPGFVTANPNDYKQQVSAMANQARGGRGSTDSGSSTSIKDYSTGIVPGGMPVFENKDHGITFNDLKTPSNNFVNAMSETRKCAGMGRGVAPEFLLGEYSTSFTAHKGALNDTMKTIYFERQRYAETVETLVNLEYLKHYVRTGMLEVMPGFWDSRYIRQAYLAGKWIGEVPGHVNPLQEVKAKLEAVNGGVYLRGDVASEFGYSDFEAFLDEREEQEKRYKMLSDAQKDAVIINETTGN